MRCRMIKHSGGALRQKRLDLPTDLEIPVIENVQPTFSGGLRWTPTRRE